MDELESKRIILKEIHDYLELCAIPAEAFHYDHNVEAWVVGCFKLGTTLEEARRKAFEYL